MKNLKYWLGLLLIAIVTVWSGIDAYETTLWFLEAGLCLVGVAALLLTFNKFKFTNLTYTIIFFEFIILLVGAHYSYARVPLFDWIREVFDQDRNNYDKLGHFFQGFAPAFISREILIRLKVLNKRSWLPFFVVCISLSISAFYELIEWWGALLIESSADDFLGMQGYEWDTQSDMLCAMLGAISMLVFFSRWQDKQINKLTNEK
ncbi:DUF2238 domain-containing protein [Dysgonomonas sp. 25]|uniref:DUF2238 domain-containing protein n=1 Tax=Dysgonomonas sp. 25 TaxID=2302933 RepID=UPI0013D47E78|nr:DUF2238 domain-containing protein [Dysgonomonas sp. 25]NDV69639.1 DUF2238 domain-containing protein [Dysgonomonas sp. 25]